MRTHRFLALLASLTIALSASGLYAQTPGEPSVHQIYETANRGDVRSARAMIDEVLQQHPASAKAHFVKAELAARDQDVGTARSELQKAERLAPGLPFAKPEAVSALRSQLERGSVSRSIAPTEPRQVDTQRMRAPEPAGAGIPLIAILLTALVIIGAFLFFRRRPPVQPAPLPGPSARDDAFGRAPEYPNAPAGYPAGYPVGQPQEGMGSTLMRGVGTGLAMGAGMVAAQEIGRRMFEHGQDPHRVQDAGSSGQRPAGDSQLARDAGLDSVNLSGNQDMGGQDFGITDGGSWDSGGVSDVGGDDWN